METKIRFLTRNIEGKSPQRILLVGESFTKNHKKMFECLCFDHRICYHYDDYKNGLVNYWKIPDFVPYLETIQVK